MTISATSLWLLARWLDRAIVIVLALCVCAAVYALRRRRALSPSASLLVLGGLFAVAANLSGPLYALTIEVLVAAEVPFQVMKLNVRYLSLRWLMVPCWGLLLAAVALEVLAHRRAQAAGKSARLVCRAAVAVGLGALSLLLRPVDIAAGDHGFFLMKDMYPYHTPKRLSRPGVTPRRVELPMLPAMKELALGLHSGQRGFPRVWGCARTAQEVWCFSPEDAHPVAERVLVDEGLTSVAVGARYACATTERAKLRCWGRHVPRRLTAFEDRPVSHFEARGLANWCVVSAGTALCNTGSISPPIAFHVPDGASKVRTGGSGPCVTTTARVVWCFHPWMWVEGVAASDVAVSGSKACAVVAQGDLVCWGEDLQPVKQADLHGVAAVALGGNHQCAVMKDGSLRCWGDNTWGQLGDGTTEDRKSPIIVPIEDVTHVAAFSPVTCVATRAGAVYCWGRRTTYSD